jgi:hypothetical protein
LTTLAALSIAQAHALRFDLGTVDTRIQAGVTSQRAKARENHWSHWDVFCVEHNADPYLQAWEDPIPMLQVFAERYRDGRLDPRKKAVRAHTVEDSIRAVAQVYSLLGAPNPHKDTHAGIDFRVQRQIGAYKKLDSPPLPTSQTYSHLDHHVYCGTSVSTGRN